MQISAQISISLVIPAYNRADLIGATVDSALAQTQPFTEIIVVDDGSTDNTATVLDHYGQKVRVIRTENEGVQAARNTGIQATSSEFVAVCDSDDLLEPTLCETIVPWLQTHQEIDICYCNFINFDETSVTADKFSQAPENYFANATKINDVFYTNIPDLYLRTLKFQPLFQSGLIFRRRFFDQIGGYDLNFKGIGAEDWEFTLRAIARGKVALCSLPLAQVRRHSGNDSAISLHMNLGEAEILDYALLNHPNISMYITEIENQCDERRRRAFDTAFAAGNFELADSISIKFKKKPSDKNYRTKKFISSLPSFLRTPTWKLTQLITN
jgi:glycosyltransferase involved in cell wall biosynthesis